MQSRRDAISRLRRIDTDLRVFGANGHRYLTHPLSADDVAQFESTLGVDLPRTYRNHLLEIGHGAGPYYGLFSPKEVMDELAEGEEYVLEFGHRPSPDGEFPLTREDAGRIHRSFDSGDEEPWGKAPYPSPGAITIAHQGCTYWTMLVTSGDLRGSVWDVACDTGYDGLWIPSRRPTALTTKDAPSHSVARLPDLPTFEQWFDSWIEATVADLAGSIGTRTGFWGRILRIK